MKKSKMRNKQENTNLKRVGRKGNMKKEKSGSVWKIGALSLAAVGISAICFNMFSQAAIAAQLSGTQRVPTEYHVEQTSAGNNAAQQQAARGNYQVFADPLEYYKDKKPAATALSMEEAAAVGIQTLTQIFDRSFDGAIVYMGYEPGTITFPRAFWSGDVRFSSERKPSDICYTFMLDAVTGEPFSAGHSRTLPVDVPLGLDPKVEKDHKVYDDLALAYVKKLGLLSEGIKSVEYNCQGYANNDPTVTIDVYGSNGDWVSLFFSRYDQMMLGIGYPTGNRISAMMSEKLAQETEKKVEEARKRAAENGENMQDGALHGLD